MLDKFFQITSSGSTIKTEIIAGLTTFITISYIAFVNPIVLSNAGIDVGSAYVGTILAAVFGCFLMGLFAKWPFAMSPGMGTNAWLVYGIVLGMGYTWDKVLAAVLLSGILLVIFSILPIRKKVIDVIPYSLKMAIAAGIGLFIIMLGFRSSGLIATSPATLLTLGDLTNPSVYLTIIGLAIIVLLESLKIRGSIIVSVLAISIIANFMGLSHFTGVVSLPPAINDSFFHFDFSNMFEIGFISLAVSLFLVVFLDSTAVFIGCMSAVGKLIPEKNIKRGLLTDGFSTIFGSAVGVNPVVSVSESAVGVVQAGGRTGLVAIVIGLCFLVLLLFSPLLTLVPLFATAPAMIYIACLMFKNIKNIEWDDITELLPAFITVVAIPFTFSILNGIGMGIIAWIVMKVLYRKWEWKYWPLFIIAMAFIAYLLIK